MLIVIGFTLIGIVAFYGALIVVNKSDKENIIIKKEIGVIFIILISTTLLYLKYKLKIDFFFLFYLSIYLIICAYIDYKTMYVYSIFNYLTIIISIVYLVSKYNEINFINVVINVIIFIAYSIIMSIFKVYGGGDNELFIATSVYIAINSKIFPLEALFLNMILANLIMIITNIKNFNIKKMKLKRKIAFAPSIAMATMILLLL